MTQRHGCVIVDPAGRIVSTGHNFKTEYHCHQYSTHAEVCALSKIKRSTDLTRHEMYVVRLSNAVSESKNSACDVELKSSMPCAACMAAIQKKRLSFVWFSHGGC